MMHRNIWVILINSSFLYLVSRKLIVMLKLPGGEPFFCRGAKHRLGLIDTFQLHKLSIHGSHACMRLPFCSAPSFLLNKFFDQVIIEYGLRASW